MRVCGARERPAGLWGEGVGGCLPLRVPTSSLRPCLLLCPCSSVPSHPPLHFHCAGQGYASACFCMMGFASCMVMHDYARMHLILVPLFVLRLPLVRNDLVTRMHRIVHPRLR